jgi:3-oxoacyl-[acyl-carrier-protein] synthase-3
MRWKNVHVEAIAHVIPDEKVSSAELESRLSPMYSALHLAPGQLETLTGIRERRRWPKGTRMSQAAALAGRKALDASGVPAEELGAVIYAGVCRDDLEPATACAVAAELGTSPDALIFDVSNACLGMLNGMVEIANRIELGQMRAGLVVSAEGGPGILFSAKEVQAIAKGLSTEWKKPAAPLRELLAFDRAAATAKQVIVMTAS